MNMDRVRVLQIVPQLITGGGQRVVMDLVENLDRQQFDVEMVSLSAYSGQIFEVYLRNQGVKVQYLHKRLGLDAHIFFEVNRVVRGFKPQVIHNHLHALYTLLPASLINRIPVRIHTIHSLAGQEAKGFHRLINRMAFNNLGVVPVSISRTVLKSVQDIYGEVDSPVIYNGIDSGKYSLTSNQSNKLREQLGISDDAFVFVNVARFSFLKNQRLIVNAFRDVLYYFPSAYLVMVGDGELRPVIANLAEELGISRRILFLGIRNDVAQILCASNCFVLTSNWEGLPISVLEAMAASKPVIATNVGGVPELISPFENGLLVETGNCDQLKSAMIELCRNPDRAKRMGERGKLIVNERFNVHEMAKQYGELYIKILGKNKKPLHS
jgi:glycosyltransferase involved in cell wall biosynthesis